MAQDLINTVWYDQLAILILPRHWMLWDTGKSADCNYYYPVVQRCYEHNTGPAVAYWNSEKDRTKS